MMFLSFNSNTTGVTCGAGTASPSEATEFTSVFCGVSFTQSLVFCVDFVNHFLSFSFDHCIVYPSTIYGFSLPLLYLQTVLS